MRIGFGPDHEHIGNRSVGNPGLAARDAITALDLLRARDHAARIRPGIGLGQAETTNQFAACQAGQIFVLLFFRTVSIDRVHHEARLHTHHAAIAGIDFFDFSRDQSIGDIRRADPAIDFGHSRPEQAQFAHFAKDTDVSGFIAPRLDHARLQFVLGISLGCIADHAFFLGQLRVEEKRVAPIKPGHAGHGVSCLL